MKPMKPVFFTVLIFLISITTFLSAQEIIRIADDEQLFLDEESIIEKSENISFRTHQVQKLVSPVLRPDQPWEGGITLLFGSVIFDKEDNIFKMWYFAGPAGAAYATSADGIHWDKPELDVYLHEGQKTNLIVKLWDWERFREIFGVYKDNDEPDPDKRYKMTFFSNQGKVKGPHENKYRRGERAGMGIAYSPDGIHFKLQDLYATEEICDISHTFYDDEIKRFVAYGRCKLSNEMLGTQYKSWGWGRGVVHLTSPDLENWTPGEFVYAAERTDPPGTEIYSVSAFPYSGIYLCMIQMYHGLPDQGRLNYQIGYSPDRKNIIRLEPRKTFLPEGDVGSWDRFNISMGDLPPVTVGDEWWFYYSGRTYRHSPYKGPDVLKSVDAMKAGIYRGQIGVAKIKRGRLYSAEASFDGGILRTRPFYFEGDKLFVNANAEYGKLTVKLLNKKNQPIEGCALELTGVDSVDIPVGFKNFDLDTLKGKAVKIEFTLENVQLYGFRVE